MSVPDEAVEVGAMAMLGQAQRDLRPGYMESKWRDLLDHHEREEYRGLARATLEAAAPSIQSAAWLEGMNNVLTWLALQRFAETMAKDNPHKRPEPVAAFPPTGFPPRPLRKDKVG